MSSVQSKVYLNQNVNPVPVSTSDLLLCSSNLLSLASTSLLNRGFNGTIPGVMRDLSSIAVNLGESILGEGGSLPKVALAASRLFVCYQVQTQPLLKPVALAMNLYGTYSVVRRGVTELNKCLELSRTTKGEYNWAIAKNIMVHGINASFSIYRTFDFANSYKNQWLSQFQKKAQTNALIDGIADLDKKNPKLTKEDLACRIVYYDPSCSTLDEAESTCAPSCKKLSEKEIRQQSAKMTKIVQSQAGIRPSDVESAKRIIASASKNLLSAPSREIVKIIRLDEQGLKRQESATTEISKRIYKEDAACAMLRPVCNQIKTEIKNGNSNEKKLTKLINEEYRSKSLKIHPDKNPNNEDAARAFSILAEAKDVVVSWMKHQLFLASSK